MEALSLVGSLPEWGVLGAFIAVVVTLVILFLNHITKREEVLLEVHRSCEKRVQDINDRCMTVITANTKATTELRDELRALDRDVKILTNRKFDC